MSNMPPPAPPKASSKPSPPPSAKVDSSAIKTSRGRKHGKAEKIGVYGPGGIGKSKLAEIAATVGFRPQVIDLECRTGHLTVDRVEGIAAFENLLAFLDDESNWSDHNMVVVDTMTVAEQMATTWTLANVPKQSRSGTEYVKNLKSYGWGDGDTFVYETFLKLFASLDRHVALGRWVLAIAHDYTATVPNPSGENYLRYEPRLMSSRQGNVSAKFREWVDHLLFVGYDVAVNREGKASGGGTRAFYAQERPTHLAKTSYASVVPAELVYEDGSAEIFNLLMQENKG